MVTTLTILHGSLGGMGVTPYNGLCREEPPKESTSLRKWYMKGSRVGPQGGLHEPSLTNRNCSCTLDMVADNGEDGWLGLIASCCLRKEPMLLFSTCLTAHASGGGRGECRPYSNECEKLSPMGSWGQRKDFFLSFWSKRV